MKNCTIEDFDKLLYLYQIKNTYRAIENSNGGCGYFANDISKFLMKNNINDFNRCYLLAVENKEDLNKINSLEDGKDYEFDIPHEFIKINGKIYDSLNVAMEDDRNFLVATTTRNSDLFSYFDCDGYEKIIEEKNTINEYETEEKNEFINEMEEIHALIKKFDYEFLEVVFVAENFFLNKEDIGRCYNESYSDINKFNLTKDKIKFIEKNDIVKKMLDDYNIHGTTINKNGKKLKEMINDFKNKDLEI